MLNYQTKSLSTCMFGKRLPLCFDRDLVALSITKFHYSATDLAVRAARHHSAVGGEDKVADTLGVSEPHVAQLCHLLLLKNLS